MISYEMVQSYKKENLPDFADRLEPEDIRRLVSWLDEKNDLVRYHSLLTLQHRSEKHPDVYPYWDILVEKLKNPNSYQRSIGLMLIAENVRWDTEKKFEPLAETFLSFCDDEKPVTVRQCIQSLAKIIPHNSRANEKIINKLISINILERKETQRKILLLDILNIMALIQKNNPDVRIKHYLEQAMTGGILDKKTKTEIDIIFNH